MESLLIVIAIVVAVFLTARAVMQPYRPRFYVGNRLPTHGIVSRARALGKRCAATERGSGLSVGTLSAIKREYTAAQRRRQTFDVRADAVLDKSQCGVLCRRAREIGNAQKSFAGACG